MVMIYECSETFEKSSPEPLSQFQLRLNINVCLSLFFRVYDLVGDKGNLTNMILRNSPNFDQTPRAIKSNPITKSRRISFTTVSGLSQEGSTESNNTPSRRINPTPVSGKPFRTQTNAFIEQESSENNESIPGVDKRHLEEERELLRSVISS